MDIADTSDIARHCVARKPIPNDTTNVIPLLGPRLVPPPTPYGRFVHARQEMARALADWLATHPGDAAARAEIDGTIALVDQLCRLEAAHG